MLSCDPSEPMPERMRGLLRKLQMERPGEFTEISQEDYEVIAKGMPPVLRLTNPALDRPNILFAGHWVTPSIPE